MSSSGSMGDPRAGRDRRVPTKARTFKHGTVDPVIQQRRPLLTWGNGILLAVMVSYGMYATGNLPQLDAFFDSLDKKARGRNDLVVHSLITYGPYLFGFVIFAVFCLFVFLFVNSRRRQLSDPKGWHKVADRAPDRRNRERRTEDLPSMVMPIGKERPHRRTSDSPAKAATPAAAEATPTKEAVLPVAAKETAATAPLEPAPLTPPPDSFKAAAMLAAARAEEALNEAPADLPSFVMPLGKMKKTQPAPSPIEIAKIAATPAALTPVSAPPTATDTSTLVAAAAAAKVDAAVAAAKAAAAKAEAAMAAAKAEAAIAEAAMAAANAEAKALNPSS
jgi:hypothetical protein